MDDVLENMQLALTITLQQAIDELGPVPNIHGPWIKRVLREKEDFILFPILGHYLEKAMAARSWTCLDYARLHFAFHYPLWSEFAGVKVVEGADGKFVELKD